MANVTQLHCPRFRPDTVIPSLAYAVLRNLVVHAPDYPVIRQNRFVRGYRGRSSKAAYARAYCDHGTN